MIQSHSRPLCVPTIASDFHTFLMRLPLGHCAIMPPRPCHFQSQFVVLRSSSIVIFVTDILCINLALYFLGLTQTSFEYESSGWWWVRRGGIKCWYEKATAATIIATPRSALRCYCTVLQCLQLHYKIRFQRAANQKLRHHRLLVWYGSIAASCIRGHNRWILHNNTNVQSHNYTLHNNTIAHCPMCKRAQRRVGPEVGCDLYTRRRVTGGSGSNIYTRTPFISLR